MEEELGKGIYKAEECGGGLVIERFLFIETLTEILGHPPASAEVEEFIEFCAKGIRMNVENWAQYYLDGARSKRGCADA